MYCDFFGLRCRPFENRADTQFIYMVPAFEEALAALEFEACHNRGMALVLGEAGIGKTLLIRSLLQRFDSAERVVVLTWPASEQADLIRETAKGFGVSLPSSHQSNQLLGRLRRHLARSLRAEHRSILVIDQAENLTTDNMAQLASLADMHLDDQRLLSVLLIGQPQVRLLLNEPTFARVAQHLFGERVLTALTREQTEAYIRHRLHAAGAASAEVFDGSAISAVHEASRGIPRLINRICNSAMLAAYGADQSQVTRDMVAEVTASAHTITRTVEAHELGLSDAGQVEAGLTSHTKAAPCEVTPTPEPVEHACKLDTDGAPGEPDTCDSPMLCEITAPERQDFTAGRQGSAFANDGEEDWTTEDFSEVPVGAETSLSIEGEGLLVRLERALSRADRMNATTEASIAQFTAVEKHLASLTAGGERLVGRLTTVNQRSTVSVEHIQEQANRIAGQAEDRLRTVEAETSRTNEASERVEERAERVERACLEAKDVESRMQSFAEALADKVDEVQERVALLMTGLEAGEATQNRLADLLERASGLTEDPDKVTAPLQAKTREIVEQATAQIDRLGQAAASFTASANEQLGEIRSTLESTKSETEKFQEKFTNAVLRQCRQEYQECLDAHLQTQKDVIEGAIAEQQARLVELMDQSGSQVRAMDEASRSTGVRIEQQRLEAEQLEKRLGDMESTLSTLPDRTMDASSRLEQLSETTNGIENSVSRLTARAETTRAELVEVVPPAEKMLRDVQAAYGRIEAVQQNVGTALVDIGGACERVNAVRDQISQCHDVVNKLETRQGEGRTTVALLEEAASTAQPLVESLRSMTVEASERSRQLESHGTSVGNTLDRLTLAGADGHMLLERIRAAIQEAEQAARAVTQQTSELTDLRGGSETAARQLDDLIASGRQLHEAMQGLVAHADEKIGQLDSHQAAATHTLGSLMEVNCTGHSILEQANASVGRVEEVAGTAMEQADRLAGLQEAGETTIGHLDDLLTSVRESQDHAQDVMSRIEETTSQLDSQEASASNTLGELSAAHQEARGIVEQVADSKAQIEQAAERANQTSRQLSSLTSASETIVPKLAELVASADRLRETMIEATTQASERVEQLDVRDAEAGRTFRELSVAHEQTRGIVEQVADSKVQIEQAAEQANDTCRQLSNLTSESETVVPKLAELVESADRLCETMIDATTRASERVEQLDARDTEAARMLRELSVVGDMGRKLLDRLEESKGTLQVLTEGATAQVERLETDAAAAATRADTSVKKLIEHNDTAEALSEKLGTASTDAGKVVTDLAQQNDRATERISAMAKRCEQVAGLTERLKSVSRLVDAAKQVEMSIKTSTETAQSISGQLVEASSAAGEQNANLQRSGALANEVIATCERLTNETGTAMEQLTVQLEVSRHAIETGQPMMNEYVTQVSELQQQIDELQGNVGMIERNLADATARPAQVVADAQTQAAQLERVCAAVRKVFSGLSQSSLEVRKHAAECSQATQQADERLAQLAEQTGRSGRLLNEWVEEAVNAQARLERTLKRCPTIYDTHPATPAARMPGGSRLAERIANRSAGGELSHLSAPPAAERQPVEEVVRATGRTEDVSKLIAEARRAVDVAKT